MRKVLRHFRRFPWVTNVTLYGCLYCGGDFASQCLTRRDKMDWTQTRNVAIVAFSFHGNFSFFWMRLLERRFPGNSIRMVMRKLFLDQTVAAPLATSVFYTGMSLLEGKDDIMEDWREKFLNTYKTGLMFWPFMQLLPVAFIRTSCDASGEGCRKELKLVKQFLNFALVPLYVRTTFTGCCAFVWATFLCFSRNCGDGTAAAALAWMFPPKDESAEEKADSISEVDSPKGGTVGSKPQS